MQKLISIYRSPKEEGMYLYLEKGSNTNNLPDILKRRFGKPEPAMSLLISPEKKLARANAITVLEAIENQGFYLQMPPGLSDPYTKKIRHANDKLGKI